MISDSDQLTATLRAMGKTDLEVETAIRALQRQTLHGPEETTHLQDRRVDEILGPAGGMFRFAPSRLELAPQEDTWNLFTLADAYKPRPPVTYIVEGLVPLPSLSIVYGAPGTLKSLLLADMAVCVAAGIEWLPPLPYADGFARKTSQIGVLWLDFDNGLQRTHERFEALGRARELSESTPLFYVSMPSPWLDATSQDSIGDLAARITARSIGLVIIDNLGTVVGKADENAPEMANVMSGLRYLAEDTGAAVVVVHHQRKSNGQQSRSGDALRGHSSIEAAIDLALLVEREDHSDLITVRSTKTRGVDVLPFSARFAFEHRRDSKELSSAKFFGIQVEDLVSDAAVDREILAAVASRRTIAKGDLTAMAGSALPGIGVNRIRGRIDALAGIGKLTSTSGKHGAKLYDLARGGITDL